MKTITFGQLKNITILGKNFTISVPFEVIDSSLIGQPEQESSSERHLLIVSMGDMRQHSWGFDSGGPSLKKVLFELGRRYVEGLIKSSTLPREYKIVMPTITVATHPAEKCPFTPSRIKEPTEAAFEVEVEKPKIGFNVLTPVREQITS